MLKMFLSILISELLELASRRLQEYFHFKKLAKENDEKVLKIMQIQDAQSRADALRDLLS